MAATVTSIMDAIKAAVAETNPEALAAAEAVELPTRIVKVLDPSITEDLEAFNAAKEMAKYANSQKDFWEEKIRTALDGADVGTIDGKPVVTVVHGKNTGLRTGVVKDGWPEAYAAAYRETEYTYLNVKKG